MRQYHDDRGRPGPTGAPTLGALVRANATARPDAPALSDGRDTLTWSAVHRLGQRVRRLVGRRAAGARVAVCGDPGILALPMVVGLLAAGASVGLFASSDLGRTEAALDLWSADGWVDADGRHDGRADGRAHPDTIEVLATTLRVRLGSRLHSTREAVPPPAVVFTTSGSTGRPRLVSCPDDRLVSVSTVIADVLGLRPDDRILSAAPAHFDYGFNQYVLAAVSGATLIQSDSLRLSHLLTAADGGPTVLATGPSHLRQLVSMPEGRVRNPGLRMITSTGSAFPVELTDALPHLWPAAEIRSMYGMTECKRVAIATHAEFQRDPVAVGRPIPGVSVSTDAATGELLVRTPFLMDFDSTTTVDGPRVVERDGERVLATGDVGRIDDGRVTVLGRMSQFAKVDDVRVSLAECERVAVHHRSVRDVAATVDDRERIVVWCEADAALDELLVRREIQAGLAQWTGMAGLLTTDVRFVDRLPRLPNGKTDRHALSHRSGAQLDAEPGAKGVVLG